MGLYDREYYHQENEDSRFSIAAGQRPIVTTLILINAAVFVIDYFSQGQLTAWFKLRADLFTHPWNAYQLLTAGFLHSTTNIWHILINMYSLWLFGRDVESFYGRREFLRLYLGLLLFSSLVWVLSEDVAARSFNSPASMLGASGAVMGVIVLFACLFPKRTLLIWGVLPTPAWVLAALFVLFNLVGAAGEPTNGDVGVAYMAHLGGAAGGYLYYRLRLNLSSVGGGARLSQWFQRRPKLKLRRPDEDDTLNAPVDKILEKISREGMDSLSRQERKLLENASRRYQQRRR